jgi:hypothetical protein
LIGEKVTVATMNDEPRFSEEQLAAENALRKTGVKQPTFTELRKAMLKGGPDGVLESAVHLEDDQYDKLVAQSKKMRYDRKARKWGVVR